MAVHCAVWRYKLAKQYKHTSHFNPRAHIHLTLLIICFVHFLCTFVVQCFAVFFLEFFPFWQPFVCLYFTRIHAQHENRLTSREEHFPLTCTNTTHTQIKETCSTQLQVHNCCVCFDDGRCDWLWVRIIHLRYIRGNLFAVIYWIFVGLKGSLNMF